MDNMPLTDQPKDTCKRCGHEFGEGDRFCSQCGYRRNAPVPWYYHPVWITLLTVTLLGPFSIYLVLKSPLMDRKTKIVMNIAIVLFTIWSCYYLYRAFSIVMTQLDQAFGIE